MRLPVLGFDPSLTHWGWASASIDLATGSVFDLQIGIEATEKMKVAKGKRANTDDLRRTKQLSDGILPLAQKAKVIFAEIPIGSQSASAMKSYAVCVAHLSFLRTLGHHIIEVDPTTVKRLFTGNPEATKVDMIWRAFELFPDANWPVHKHKGTLLGVSEHMADAIAVINAGLQTPEFSTFLEQYAP